MKTKLLTAASQLFDNGQAMKAQVLDLMARDNPGPLVRAVSSTVSMSLARTHSTIHRQVLRDVRAYKVVNDALRLAAKIRKGEA